MPKNCTMIKDMPDTEVLTLVKRYARYHHNTHSNYLGRMQYDDLLSYMLEAVFMLSKKYMEENEELPNKSFIVSALSYRVIDLVREYIKQDRRESFACEIYVGTDDPEIIYGLIECDLDSNIRLMELLRHFEGRELLIVKEILAPSEAVADYYEAYMAKFPSCDRDGLGTTDRAFRHALGAVYGITKNEFYYAKKGIREKLLALQRADELPKDTRRYTPAA